MTSCLQPLRLAALAAALTNLMLMSSASAQYTFDPKNADEQGDGIKYFGSVKDDRGALLPSASIFIHDSIVLITDAQGRFRGDMDPIYTIDRTAVRCSKPGYQQVRLAKRPGPARATKKTVQVDCVLRKIA